MLKVSPSIRKRYFTNQKNAVVVKKHENEAFL